MRGSGLDLTRGAALALVCLSGVAGLATLVLSWRSLFGLARLTAALAVAAVVVGWAAAQAPRFLPGMTVTQAAAGESTLVALVIAVACGSAILLPSLALLYGLFLRGRLDTPESHASGDPHSPGTASAAAGLPPADAAADPRYQARTRANAAGRPEAAERPEAAGRPEATGRPSTAGHRGAVRRLQATALTGLVAGAGLLVFTDGPWTQLLGVAGLLLCAGAVFWLTAAPVDR
jgi:cytochrome d ubiquinol oxidase subunit II